MRSLSIFIAIAVFGCGILFLVPLGFLIYFFSSAKTEFGPNAHLSDVTISLGPWDLSGWQIGSIMVGMAFVGALLVAGGFYLLSKQSKG
jgi:hypothetical protein